MIGSAFVASLELSPLFAATIPTPAAAARITNDTPAILAPRTRRSEVRSRSRARLIRSRALCFPSRFLWLTP
ncbi:hypothetical protein GCM10022245_03260 [Streptomyces mayteni]